MKEHVKKITSISKIWKDKMKISTSFAWIFIDAYDAKCLIWSAIKWEKIDN